MDLLSQLIIQARVHAEALAEQQAQPLKARVMLSFARAAGDWHLEAPRLPGPKAWTLAQSPGRTIYWRTASWVPRMHNPGTYPLCVFGAQLRMA